MRVCSYLTFPHPPPALSTLAPHTAASPAWCSWVRGGDGEAEDRVCGHKVVEPFERLGVIEMHDAARPLVAAVAAAAHNTCPPPSRSSQPRSPAPIRSNPTSQAQEILDNPPHPSITPPTHLPAHSLSMAPASASPRVLFINGCDVERRGSAKQKWMLGEVVTASGLAMTLPPLLDPSDLP
jgi:hypothetical protein